MPVTSEPIPGMIPQGTELFPDSPKEDGYELLPEDAKLTEDFLSYEVGDLDRLKNNDLNDLFDEYFKLYPRKPHAGLSSTPPKHVRLFRGEINRDEYNKHKVAGVGTGRWWSAFLNHAVGYAHGGKNFGREHLYYIDVPEAVAQQHNVLRIRNKYLDRVSTNSYEFYIPEEYATGKKVEVKEMDWDLVDELLHDGEYTESGLNRDDLSDEELRIASVRETLTKMAFSSMASYWLYQNYQEMGNTATRKPVEKPRILPDAKATENLLARVCGWR